MSLPSQRTLPICRNFDADSLKHVHRSRPSGKDDTAFDQNFLCTNMNRKNERWCESFAVVLYHTSIYHKGRQLPVPAIAEQDEQYQQRQK